MDPYRARRHVMMNADHSALVSLDWLGVLFSFCETAKLFPVLLFQMLPDKGGWKPAHRQPYLRALWLLVLVNMGPK